MLVEDLQFKVFQFLHPFEFNKLQNSPSCEINKHLK